jgi:hypothetical protein
MAYAAATLERGPGMEYAGVVEDHAVTRFEPQVEVQLRSIERGGEDSEGPIDLADGMRFDHGRLDRAVVPANGADVPATTSRHRRT